MNAIPPTPVRVLVVDDSAVVRRALSQALCAHPGIDVVATASDAFEAREQIAAHEPDVVTLDVDMPRMNGLDFLERLMIHYPLPVVVVTSLAHGDDGVVLRALDLGAREVVPKPRSVTGSDDMAAQLTRAVLDAARPRRRRPDGREVPSLSELAFAALSRDELARHPVIIGASTGGTRAIEDVLARFPPASPGVLVCQHLPASFTDPFARRLDSICGLRVREARDRDTVEPGLALVAPGGHHLVLRRADAGYNVRLDTAPPVHHQRPAVDVLFDSAAAAAGPDAVGVLLTGMGEDGAAGLLAMRDAGAHTIVEAEETCVVYGMPRAAAEIGAAAQILPLPDVAPAICAAVVRHARRAALAPQSPHGGADAPGRR